MINYSGLPQRVRRIIKTYEYCIESVQQFPYSTCIRLKEGYVNNGQTSVNLGDIEVLIAWLKAVTKPPSREIKTALFGFKCPICGCQVHKGSNYIDIGGLKTCTSHLN